jgi:hypothetical protein
MITCQCCIELRLSIDSSDYICEYCKFSYDWNHNTSGSHYYDKATGKIEATVTRIGFPNFVWNVNVRGDDLGNFISESHAKEAIEINIKNRNLIEARKVASDYKTMRYHREHWQKMEYK